MDALNFDRECSSILILCDLSSINIAIRTTKLSGQIYQQQTHPTLHWIGIDLTHVSPRVVLLDVGHVKLPRVVAIVSDG